MYEKERDEILRYVEIQKISRILKYKLKKDIDKVYKYINQAQYLDENKRKMLITNAYDSIYNIIDATLKSTVKTKTPSIDDKPIS